MDIQYLSEEDIMAFEGMYPGAAAFLRHHNLIGERRFLECMLVNEVATDWQKERLEELRKFPWTIGEETSE